MEKNRDKNDLAFRTITDREDFTEEEQAKRRHGMAVGARIVQEGCVLLKNDGLLPLRTDKVNVFGALSAQPYFGGRGSSCAMNGRATGFYTALEDAGIAYHPTLYRLMKNWVKKKKVSAAPYPPEREVYRFKPASVASTIAEVLAKPYVREFPAERLTEETMRAAAAYSDTALVMLGRSGSEQHDMAPEELRLLPAERRLLCRVTQYFDKVVLILNTAGVFQLDFLRDLPQIRAVLSIGYPARTGMCAVAQLLTGAANPSGRLVDTFLYDVQDHPAFQNTGTYRYANARRRHFLLYKEDLYVGYRYTETFYSQEEYSRRVQFPFGFGLSYTAFAWENAALGQTEDGLRVTLSVKNIGQTAGKDVVELFVEAPYHGGIEKARKVLAAFEKTRLLAPGESQQLTVEFPKYAFMSFDTARAAYVLEAGDYVVHLSKNAHDSRIQLPFTQEAELVYRQDPATGNPLARRFAGYEGGFRRLSRKDGPGARPAAPAGEDWTAGPQVASYPRKAFPPFPQGCAATGKECGLRLADLQGKPWDDPDWGRFLDQFTAEEMAYLISHGGYQTRAVERLGLPATIASDGPAGIHDSVTARAGISYPSGTTLASTWNPALAEEYGKAIGAEAAFLHVQEWYGPSMNLHRSPFGGRCFEYYSEDPLLSGKTAAAVVRGAQSQGLACHIKHFALNEEDRHRLSVHTWCSEQAIREIYAKPFEYAVKEGGALGVMSALNCVGPDWSGGCAPLQTGLLREEWGFRGCVVTDYAVGYMSSVQGVFAGNDLWLAPMGNGKFEKPLLEAAKKAPAQVIPAMKKAVKNICWMVLSTNAAPSAHGEG